MLYIVLLLLVDPFPTRRDNLHLFLKIKLSGKYYYIHPCSFVRYLSESKDPQTKGENIQFNKRLNYVFAKSLSYLDSTYPPYMHVVVITIFNLTHLYNKI